MKHRLMFGICFPLVAALAGCETTPQEQVASFARDFLLQALAAFLF